MRNVELEVELGGMEMVDWGFYFTGSINLLARIGVVVYTSLSLYLSFPSSFLFWVFSVLFAPRRARILLFPPLLLVDVLGKLDGRSHGSGLVDWLYGSL